MTVFGSLLITEFAPYRKARASDGAGGWSEAYVPMATFQGRYRPLNATERIAADKAEARIDGVLYCGAAVDIARGDIVTGGGITAAIVAVREPSLAGHHLEVDCRQTQPEETTWLES